MASQPVLLPKQIAQSQPQKTLSQHPRSPSLSRQTSRPLLRQPSRSLFRPSKPTLSQVPQRVSSTNTMGIHKSRSPFRQKSLSRPASTVSLNKQNEKEKEKEKEEEIVPPVPKLPIAAKPTSITQSRQSTPSKSTRSSGPSPTIKVSPRGARAATTTKSAVRSPSVTTIHDVFRGAQNPKSIGTSRFHATPLRPSSKSTPISSLFLSRLTNLFPNPPVNSRSAKATPFFPRLASRPLQTPDTKLLKDEEFSFDSDLYAFDDPEPRTERFRADTQKVTQKLMTAKAEWEREESERRREEAVQTIQDELRELRAYRDMLIALTALT
ncbi:hypothetical protein P7C73_g6543, partial [Tremellales sp. Uapishka_1]